MRLTGAYWLLRSPLATERCRGTLCHALKGVRPTTTAKQVHKQTLILVAAAQLLGAVAKFVLHFLLICKIEKKNAIIMIKRISHDIEFESPSEMGEIGFPFHCKNL